MLDACVVMSVLYFHVKPVFRVSEASFTARLVKKNSKKVSFIFNPLKNIKIYVKSQTASSEKAWDSMHVGL